MRTVLVLLFGIAAVIGYQVASLAQEEQTEEWDPEVVELLEKASSYMEEDRQQREDSINRLVEIGAPAVPYLCTRMDTDNVMEHIALVNTLEKIGEPAVDELHKALEREKTEKARRLVMTILSRIGSEKSVQVFEEALKDPLWAFRASAAAGLGKVENEETTKLLTGLLDDPSDEVRLMALLALADRADDENMARIIDLIDDESYIVRFGVAEVAEGYGEPVVPMLKKKLESVDNLVVKLLIIKTLGNTKSNEAAGIIEGCFEDEEPLIRAYAAEAYAKLPKENAREELQALLNTESVPLVRKAIEKALDSLPASTRK